MDKLFPFSFSIDGEFNITHCGNSLNKILPSVEADKNKFFDLFEIKKPSFKNKIEFENLKSIAGNFVLISILNLEKIFLKGQFELREDTDELTFFGTLWVDEYEKMRDLGLTYTDFPAYDPIFDIQQMKSVLENEQEDIRNLKNDLNIINLSSDLFLTLHSSGLIKKSSPSSLPLLGIKPHELIGENIQSLFYSDDEFDSKKEISEIIATGKSKEYITYMCSKKNLRIGISMSITPVKVDEQSSTHIVCVIRDITERLKNIEEINNLASFPNENPNPIFRIDKFGNILFCNKAGSNLKKITYNNKEYELDKFWNHIFSNNNESKILSIDTRSGNKHITFNIIEREGSDHMNIYGTDITDRISSEEKAQENFNNLNNFLESTNEVYYLIYQQNTEKNFFTSGWTLFLGFNPEKVDIWKEKRACVESEFLKAYDDAVRDLKSSGSMSVKYKIKNKISGHIRWIFEETKIKFDPILNDEIISGRMTDINKSVNYKKQIKESEERFQLITESMPVMIWVSNENNIITYSNQESRAFYGFDLKDILSEEFAEYVHPDYRKIAIDDWGLQIKAKRKCDVQYLAKNKNGDYRWIYEIAVPRFLNNNQFIGYIGCGFDITSERKMFYTLEEEKRKYELLSNQSADIILLMNNTGIIEYVSPSIKRILGYEELNIVGNSFFDLLEKSNNLSIKDFTENGDKLKNNVLSFQIKDAFGEMKWIEASFNTFKEDTLGGEKIIIHLRDINEQYIAQAMIIENEAKYRTLFSNMNLGVMEVDIEERILYVNPAFERISGYAEPELVGNIAPEIFLQELSEKEINLQERRNREHGKEGLYEIGIKRKDGIDATWVISGAPIFDMRGKVRGSIGIHWDVTEIRDLETKILYESVQKEKQLMEAKLQAEEDQRDMIGRDLHDGVGQMLAYLSVYMNILKEKPNVNFEDIDKAQSTIGKTIDEVRRLSRNLAPPAIKDLGFRDAVIELISSYSIIPKPAFNLKIYKRKDPDIFLYEHKLMFFRVLQELSSNTFKYAKSNKVDIKIDYDTNEMKLVYKDDGVGFDIKTVIKGIGLKSILSRVEFYGGAVKIKTNPGQGTEVTINLPFEQTI